MSEEKIVTGKDMQDQIRKTTEYYRKILAENEAMTSEIAASKRIIWAMVNTKGGVIRIPDRIMASANDSANSIESSYDPKDSCTVIKSITMGRKKSLHIIE